MVSLGGSIAVVPLRSNRPGYVPTVSLLHTERPRVEPITTIDLRAPLMTDTTGGRTAMLVTSPFDENGAVVAVRGGPTTIYVADPERWEIRAYAAGGRLSEIVRAAIAREPVTAALIARGRDSLFARETVWDRSLLGEAYDRLEHPDSVTAIGSLFWDESGYLWVGRMPLLSRQPPNEFEVFGEGGEWLGGVSVPRDAGWVMDVGAGRVVTVWADDLGVFYVRVYRVRR